LLYLVRSGDTLFRIGQRHRISLNALLKANIICNPRLAIPGDLLRIPREGISLPRLGSGGPYYILQPGDSLECVAHYTGNTVPQILRNNSIHNIRRLFPGSELLIGKSHPVPEELYNQWLTLPVNDQLTEQQINLCYNHTFTWQALGKKAIPWLLKLLSHSCPEIRYYTVLSLGRIGIDQGAIGARAGISEDRFSDIRKMARLALDRILLNQQGYRRTRLLIKADRLYDDLNRVAPAVTSLVEGMGITILKWYIPVGKSEAADPEIYDYVVVAASGQKGFIKRHQGRLNYI